MSYSAVVEIATNQSLISRVTAAAAVEGEASPAAWTTAHMWKVAAQPGWADDWDYAKDTANVNQNPDIGMRIDVISDDKILTAVQTIRAAEALPAEPPAAEPLPAE